MKKFIINTVLIIISFIIYYLQLNFFNWFNISGIMPNMFIILVLFIGLFASKSMGAIYGIIIGTIWDLVLGTKVGMHAVSLGVIGFIAGVFDKNFSKNNRITIMLMVFGSTILSEIVVYLMNYFFIETSLEVWAFVKIIIIETLFNVILTIILYPLIERFGYYIENEFKGNKILTRYF